VMCLEVKAMVQEIFVSGKDKKGKDKKECLTSFEFSFFHLSLSLILCFPSKRFHLLVEYSCMLPITLISSFHETMLVRKSAKVEREKLVLRTESNPSTTKVYSFT